ncbi:MAG: 16S rRNA (guanine(966)-N(2))-methyltransferase RsmD [Acidobacteria bacterium]|nr:16S rRNA (guanine(966)-N(2))-methyltransferase RsmD [Acidobacteriota bacterium]
MGNLRVIGGERRGFPLVSPKGGKLRPTANRVREALFDILGERVWNSRFLDLFAGTGAVGIEALSRGAASCLFVEENPLNIRAIKNNLQVCRLEGAGEVYQGSLPSCLPLLQARGLVDLVFVDPPYEARTGDLVLRDLGLGGLLRAGSWVILEHRKSTHSPTPVGCMRHLRTVRYGDTALSFFESATAGSLSAERV